MIKVQRRKYYDLTEKQMLKVIRASKKKKALKLESSAVDVVEKSNGKFDVIWEYVLV